MHPDYQLVEVNSRKLIREFLNFPSRLYKNDKNWIRPLDIEVEKVFDPKQNKMFLTGEAIRWLLVDKSGKTIGRVAAFYEWDSAKKNEQLTGGIGFFECINDQKAANMLFDAGKNWLQKRGVQAMDGPVNFGDRDHFWGCLAEGFHEPVYNMPYNFKYYNELFENYGFKNYFNQYTYRKIIADGASDSTHEKALRLLRNPDYRFENYRKEKEADYGREFIDIYNKAWSQFEGVKPITPEEGNALFRMVKQVMDKRAFYYGYYKDEPIAIFIMIPDINQLIKGFNGKLNLWNKIRLFARLRIFHRCDRLMGLVFGVVPEHQGKGVESAIIYRFEQESYKPGFPFIELQMNWIGDFNPLMMKMVERQVRGKIYKTHITYRYLFDRSKPFKRAEKVSIKRSKPKASR